MKAGWFRPLMLLALLVSLCLISVSFARDFKFFGSVESLPASGLVGDWKVSGRTVHVTATTTIDQSRGKVAQGAFVEVEGTVQANNSINATKIAVLPPPEFEIHGSVESLPASGLIGDWKVSGRTVHVTATTTIDQSHGQVAKGAFVEVRGTFQADFSINATKIAVQPPPAPRPFEFLGTIETLPASGLTGDWKVSGRTVHVTAATTIDQSRGQVVKGALVEVEGTVQTDNSINATKVVVKSPQGPGNPANFEFRGAVEALPTTANLVGDWKVAGKVVHVTATTVIEKNNTTIAVGTNVEVEGTRLADGSINATRIEVKPPASPRPAPPFILRGTIETLPTAANFVGDWKVAGKTVHVTATTVIDHTRGAVAKGAYVVVKGALQADGSINATKIVVTPPPTQLASSEAAQAAAANVDLYSTIEGLPETFGFAGNWEVGGVTVHVTSATRLVQEHSIVAFGAYVAVEGLLQADHSINATRIEVMSNTAASVDAAGYTRSAAPGQILAVFGAGVSSGASLSLARSVPLPTELQNVSVRVNGLLAPLFFVSANATGAFQINYQLPYEALPGEALVEVMDDSTPVASEFLVVSEAGPGIFTRSSDGRGQAIVLNQDFSLNGDSGRYQDAKPEGRGRVIVVFANGQGGQLVDAATLGLASMASGDIARGLYLTALNPTVTIGGVPARVEFSGLAPGFVGLWQLNIVIPEDAPVGDAVPLVITMDGWTSNTTTIAVY